MDSAILILSIVIQALAVVMVLYTFYRISHNNFPKLKALEDYHMMRKRYERLRLSLLFVSALIAVQLAGVLYYFQSGTIPVLQLLISDIVVVALIIFLSRIYKMREHLDDIELQKKRKE